MNNTKGTIIDTALKLFTEKGYDETTVMDICNACSITKPTFYYHLTSKDDILSSFFDDVIAGMSDKLLQTIAAKNEWEQLVACFEILMDSSEHIGVELYSQIYIINLREDKKTFDLQRNMTDLAVLLIDRAQSSGQIRNKSDPLSLYLAAAHAFEGYELLWCIKKGGFDRRKAFRVALEDLLDVEPRLRCGLRADYTPYLS